MQGVEINYLNIEKNSEYDKLIKNIITTCFKEEKLSNLGYYISIILTNPNEIKRLNKQYRNIDKETDVLSFPIFEKEEIDLIVEKQKKSYTQEVLGDIVISIERVNKQAKEYGHSFERELSYMVVHGFYHIIRIRSYWGKRKTNYESKGRIYIRFIETKKINI